ncbi:hypothetical protein [Pseudoduganella aquatica]|uniref:DUF2987 domain-containing protein n=1 Tax=Pseudoduganella aquatica TaxID=2660641 RepID=A0A7X4HFV6_9BURK|nr:hypothetical protein [Pseudoduganella aquatica]MYN10491.1 hypothetical protein [Pseudoduganella aquatica]
MKKLALTLLCALPLLAHAEDREWAPYKKIVETVKLDKFYSLPAAERDKLKVYARFTPANKAIAPGSLKLTVVHAGGKSPLVLDELGRTVLVPNEKWMAEDAKIWTNQPKGEKASVGFDIVAVLPEAAQWNYATVMGSVPQSNAAIDKVAGALSLLAPTMKVVIFKFHKPAYLVVQAKGGEKRYVTDGRQQIRLKLDKALLAENPLVTVSEQPFEAEVDGE